MIVIPISPFSAMLFVASCVFTVPTSSSFLLDHTTFLLLLLYRIIGSASTSIFTKYWHAVNAAATDDAVNAAVADPTADTAVEPAAADPAVAVDVPASAASPS